MAERDLLPEELPGGSGFRALFESGGTPPLKNPHFEMNASGMVNFFDKCYIELCLKNPKFPAGALLRYADC